MSYLYICKQGLLEFQQSLYVSKRSRTYEYNLLLQISTNAFCYECVKSKCGPLQFFEIYFGPTLPRLPIDYYYIYYYRYRFIICFLPSFPSQLFVKMQITVNKATHFVNECVKSKCGPLQFPEIHYGPSLPRLPQIIITYCQ